MTSRIDAVKWKGDTWQLFLADVSNSNFKLSPEGQTPEKIKALVLEFFKQQLEKDLSEGKEIDFTVCGCKTKEDFVDDITMDVNRRVIAAWSKEGPFSAYYPPSDPTTSSWCSIQ